MQPKIRISLPHLPKVSSPKYYYLIQLPDLAPRHSFHWELIEPLGPQIQKIAHRNPPTPLPTGTLAHLASDSSDSLWDQKRRLDCRHWGLACNRQTSAPTPPALTIIPTPAAIRCSILATVGQRRILTDASQERCIESEALREG